MPIQEQVTGRSPEGRTVATVGTTSGSAAITGPAGSFHVGADVGRPISGTGIPAATTILSVASATAATMSANATATGTITATLGAGINENYGFRGWSPESDAESRVYTIAGGGGASAPDHTSDITTPRARRRNR